jgi:hypothetical protein
MSGNVIDRGLGRIRKDGWARNSKDATTGVGHCMWTSLNGVQQTIAVATLIADVISEETGREYVYPGISFIFDFNDDPATSFEDMALVMKKASARLDEAQSA